MRTLTFDKGVHEQEYRFLYDALVTKEGGFGTAELRRLNKVLDKLEPIGKSTERTGGKNPVVTYELGEGGTVLLEDSEYEFLKKITDNTPWVGLHSRKVANLLDMIENAPEVKVEKVEDKTQ